MPSAEKKDYCISISRRQVHNVILILKSIYGDVEGKSVHVMGLPESELITFSTSDESTTNEPSSTNSTDANEEETGETKPPSKTRTARDTEHSDEEEDKATENEETEAHGDAFDELLEDFNAAFSLTGDDQSGLFTIFLQEPGKTARIQGGNSIENYLT